MLFLNAIWFEEGSQGLWSLLFLLVWIPEEQNLKQDVIFVLEDPTENKKQLDTTPSKT